MVAELDSVAPLNNTLRLLAVERKILADVVAGRALQAALTELVGVVQGLVGRKALCTLFLYERESGQLGHALATELPPPLIALETGADFAAVSPARLALAHGESVFLEAAEAWGKLGAPPPLRAAWATPVLSIDGRKLGALAVYFQRPVRPTMRDRELLLIAANSVTLAIKRSNSDMILHHREAELARVQRIGGVGGVEVDLRAGFHNRRSPEYLAIHGLPPEAAHESHEDWVRRIHPDDRERAEQAFLDAVASGAEDYASEYRIVRPSDGETRWISVRARIERDAEGHALRLIGAHIDITDRMLAEEKLRESEERFRLIANSAPVPIWVSKLNGQRAFANQAYLDFLGMGYEEALVFDWRKVLHPDDLPRILKEQIAGESSLKPFVLEARYLRADGKWRWIRSESQPRWDAAGRHSGFIGVAHDITASKGAENDLRRLNENLAIEVATRTRERDRIWNVSQDLLLVLDRRGNWLSVNPAWEDATRWTPDQLLGPTNVEHEHLPVLQRARKSLTRFASDDSAARFESSFPVQGGGERWIAWTSVLDEDLIYAVGRDVTAEKDAQRTLRATEEQLRQAHKMEAVGQLTGGIAHDFNNLLTSIIGGLELAKRRIATRRFDEVDRFIEPVMNSAHRAAALTHRLLAFSRRQSLDVKPIDVGKLIESMEDLFSRTLGNQIALAISADSDIWITETDQNQLENAVLNLVINARDAMPEGGLLTIEARNLAVASDDDVTAGDYVSIVVRDQGIGMTAAEVERAFDPFFTTKPIGQGTGLGLSMVYGFTKQSRGHVRIDSKPAEGTTVTLLLPRSARSLPESKDSAASRTMDPKTGGTILVVEDEPAVRLVVSESLAELGYRTIEAHDGASALALMDQRSKIDLLITDVGLPGMNGRQLAELAQVKRPALKVLFMTGYAEKAAAGADFWSATTDLITKPFEARAFAAKVREIIER